MAASVQLQLRHSHVMRTFLRFYHKRIKEKPLKSNVPVTVTDYRDERAIEIIDVRTPAEFHHDHIPGSVNMPVLSDEERGTVGTLYNKDKFAARKMGAAIICRNISEHIQNYFSSKELDYSPLLYCWRGGQRSYSMAVVLAQIGFETYVLENGYQRYRESVRDDLSMLPDKFQYNVISGLTGTGKTRILHALKSQGHQIIDLEGLAKHKGSVLGLQHGETQPSQKYFESVLCHELLQCSPDQPVWLESESVRIGNRYVPKEFITRLQESPRYNIVLPNGERVKHIMRDYSYWITDKESLKVIVRKFVRSRGHSLVNHWLELIDNGKWAEFVEHILLEHYDPLYTSSQKKNNRSQLDDKDVIVKNLDDVTVNRVAAHLSSMVSADIRGLSQNAV